ncbi:MAG: hypothetical protein HY791_31730 [Deltaproteobacteria bacterium]|nr:hypothetical protein [Deltaproteobacteria bacterium]
MKTVWTRTLTRTLFALPVALSLLAGGSVAVAGPEKAPATKKAATGIEWVVAPKEVVIYLDGKKIGTAGDLSVTETRPGKHEVRLVHGEDETEMDVNVEKGKVLRFEFAFEGK